MKFRAMTAAAIATLTLLNACGEKPDADEAIVLSIASTDRPEEDIAKDTARLPLETLTFAGLEPGMRVLELEAGGGYYTEILARAVGKNGVVYMQNPPAFDAFLGDTLTTRLGEERLPNVEVMRTNFDALTAKDNSIDLVTWIQGPHELWYAPNGENLGDPEKAFAEIARVLKPGGTFLVVDHNAPEGSGTEAGGSLHRIEFSIVEQMAKDAGLTFKESSAILTRASDPLTANVFDASVYGKTSQFVATFTKPK